jgi:hypothetical protein
VQEKVEGTSVGCAAGQTLGSPRRPLMAPADSTVSGRGGGDATTLGAPFIPELLLPSRRREGKHTVVRRTREKNADGPAVHHGARPGRSGAARVLARGAG